VSTDTGAFDRSTLDQKDRSELQTIAEAMGGKPGSRLRKAEIVDMILSLAGVETSEAGDGDDGAESKSKNGEKSLPFDGDDDDDDDDDGDDDDDDDAGGSDDDGDADSNHSNGSSGKQQRRNGRDDGDDGKKSKKNGGGKGSDNKSASDGKDSDSKNADGRGGDNDDRKQRGSNKSGDSGQNQGDRYEDGGSEPANRRRRRRGRDRSRDEGQVEWDGKTTPVEGALDLREEGFGFLRIDGAMPSVEDIYVPIKLVRQHGLRRGDHITGGTRPANRNEKNSALVEISSINGADPENSSNRPQFDDLDAVFSTEPLTLQSGDASDLTGRAIDLLAPVGRGQRALIIGHPKVGGTTILREIALALQDNHSDIALMVLLVDEQPEVIADMRNALAGVEMMSSTFDGAGEEHIAVAELAVERAKRMVESGRDVCILLGGLSRLARAYNLGATGNGRTLAGGLDAAAIFDTKALFGAARNVEGEGSLTILATAAADTGSAIDAAILDELLPTSTMQLRLDLHAASRRLHPPIDIAQSGTDNEAMLLGDDYAAVQDLRRSAADIAAADALTGNSTAISSVLTALANTSDNANFLKEVGKSGLGS